MRKADTVNEMRLNMKLKSARGEPETAGGPSLSLHEEPSEADLEAKCAAELAQQQKRRREMEDQQLEKLCQDKGAQANAAA